MDGRSARRTAAQLTAALLLVIGACSNDSSEGTSESAQSTSAAAAYSTSSTAPTTTTPLTATTTTTSTTTTALAPEMDTWSPPSGAEVLIPDGAGPFPAVVLVHGGGWLVGNPTSMEPLAGFLTENGHITVNATYQLSLQSPGFPTAIEDVVCALAYAASHPLSNGEVTLIGHSAGAHISALAAFDGPEYPGTCEIPGPDYPDQFIGLAGPYDITRVGPIMVPFFGGPQVEIPEIWDAGNPPLHAGDNLDLRSLLIHGSADQVVPADFSENFYDDMIAVGSDVELLVLEGLDHAGARDPDLVGPIILDWLTP